MVITFNSQTIQYLLKMIGKLPNNLNLCRWSQNGIDILNFVSLSGVFNHFIKIRVQYELVIKEKDSQLNDDHNILLVFHK